MHLAGNLSDLLISLWRGTLDCGTTDDVDTWDWVVLADGDTWIAHGNAVEKAGPYLPGSFDRKPRNISEKINTSYETWEFQLYTFGLTPALLYGILPDKYWTNYCQLVRGFQLMCQHRITSQDIADAYKLLCIWEHNFELLYYQLKEDRLQMVRPCVHQTSHLVSETIQKGPPICYAQWTMERTIGNLGLEICQPSRPYANLSQEGIRRCRVNTLLSAMPELDEPPKGLPPGAVDLGDRYALLRKRDKYPLFPAVGDIAEAIMNFLGPGHVLPRIKHWARLLLPNRQIARSVWRETLKALEQTRMSRNIKLKYEGQDRFGEVLYFTRLAIEADTQFADVAVVQMYSAPDESLLRLSSQTVASCTRLETIAIVNVKNIISMIAMVPHRPTLPSGVTEDHFFMVEKPGLDISNLGVPYGAGDDNINDDNDIGDDGVE
ncbi:hypothetical protein DFH29DRAFT_817662 [Suillus ampliporus]|nr:hypothetical protein DFH29DRAFT_817662 [Suillus ampliporus]